MPDYTEAAMACRQLIKIFKGAPEKVESDINVWAQTPQEFERGGGKAKSGINILSVSLTSTNPDVLVCLVIYELTA